ncbi:subclass B3 metallo-beta-lactamase [Gemmatimonas sp.]|uniref:subclass B3 metallo-beta-lactamase n=1 Tax=Gemmatimonas sp. TaxID=1962908 RepID=UPI00334048B7
MMRLLFLFLLVPALAIAQTTDSVPPTPRCASCPEWNKPHAPFKLYGNSWYVGTDGLSAILITSSAGHILIDGGLQESAPLIRRNIEALGFRLTDVKLMLNSHAHNDHAGGLAMLARLSGATVAASAPSARWLQHGNSFDDDPQFGLNAPYPRVPKVRTVRDGEVVRVGTLALTAHITGGHTPGGTSWSWQSCEANVCHDIVYADSQSPISADGFRFSSNTRYPTAVQDFRRAHTLFETMRCDILVMPHPSAAQLWERVAGGTLIDARGCKRMAANARLALDNRLATEGVTK